MKHLQKKVHLPDTMDTICKSRFPSPSLLGAVQQFEGWNITLLLQDISGAAINFAKELWEESAFGKSAKTYIPFVLHEMAVHREMAWCSQFRGNMSHLIALAHDTPRTRKCSRFTYFEFFAASRLWILEKKMRFYKLETKINSWLSYLGVSATIPSSWLWPQTAPRAAESVLQWLHRWSAMEGNDVEIEKVSSLGRCTSIIYITKLYTLVN